MEKKEKWQDVYVLKMAAGALTSGWL